VHAYSSTNTETCNDLLKTCASAQDVTLRDPSRRELLELLGRKVSKLEQVVRGYELIEDRGISTDDEIINWAFSEAPADFGSGIWLLSAGFYKASASCIRNAYDIATASLYFQVRENTDAEPRAYNRFFREWDKGERQTPNWGEMKDFLAKQPSFKKFETNEGTNAMEKAYEQFKYLCSFTHTSAFTGKGDPVTVINSTGRWPVFDETYFRRGASIVANTLSFTAILWKIAFPQISIPADCEELFQGTLGAGALRHS